MQQAQESVFLTPKPCAVESNSADSNVNVASLGVSVSCVCLCTQLPGMYVDVRLLILFKSCFGVLLSSQAKDKPNNLLMRSLMHVQEAALGILYITVTDGRNVPVCLQWKLNLGCAYELRVYHQFALYQNIRWLQCRWLSAMDVRVGLCL